MLRSTFQILRGVSPAKERKLWERDVLSWEDYEFLVKNATPFLFREMQDPAVADLNECKLALRDQDLAFFRERLPKAYHYRIALAFPHDVLFVDIETTGLSRYYDDITLVGWSIDGEYDALIQGEPPEKFRSVLQKARILVTFNGTLFDLPFLRQQYPDIRFPGIHLDLRYLAKRVNLTGGQKKIESELGFRRKADIGGMDGENAPVLWRMYRKGDVGALKKLIQYNHADVEGMRHIMEHVVGRLMEAEGVPEPIRKSRTSFPSAKDIPWLPNKGNGNAQSGIHLAPYTGNPGPRVSLAELLNQFEPLRSFRAVGIDLTGSESRPSGWCSLVDGCAATMTLASDDEIVEATLEANPDLVSIDSPLSLPAGRVSVFDSDPGHQQFGIMRQCERVLKKRGVNVYPALIQSMQKLTDRGMRLASRFRAKGLPVIESYPGAAQDIMNIPRKRKGLDLLKEGLAEFGVRGAFETEKVTHDEVDAITSAIVGLFFWSGRFEALGDDEEEYLIIPDLRVDSTAWRSRKCIGFSGPLAAGKTTAARHLEGERYRYARYSMVIEDMLRKNGDDLDRQNMQALGQLIHQEIGQRWLGRELLALVEGYDKIVIDGLRWPEDHAFLVESFGPSFTHVHVDAPEATRRVRYERRDNGAFCFDEARRHSVEAGVPSLAHLASATVPNTDSLDSFLYRVEQIARG